MHPAPAETIEELQQKLAEVRFSCGRHYLSVAGIAVAMEGDKCRDGDMPDDVYEPIPDWEMEQATIGGQSIKGMDPAEIRFFRGSCWTENMLRYAAEKINAAQRQQGQGDQIQRLEGDVRRQSEMIDYLRKRNNELKAHVLSWPETQRRTFTVKDGQLLDVCRVCKEKSGVKEGGTFLLHFGKEFAHSQCLESKPAQPQPPEFDVEGMAGAICEFVCSYSVPIPKPALTIGIAATIRDVLERQAEGSVKHEV